ncbi:MAG: hypothetical protein OIN86_04680 [Candidatus Methanoperedens sp.]|nr:hypothetical protein [Candidatus Methanoperedens sp.]CAG0996782.1 hypothetical protein METP1_02619 [Methanosarcinales archaeon]
MKQSQKQIMYFTGIILIMGFIIISNTPSTPAEFVKHPLIVEPPPCFFDNSCTTPTPTTVITTTTTCNAGFFFDSSTNKCIPDLKPNFTAFFLLGLIFLGLIYNYFVRK